MLIEVTSVLIEPKDLSDSSIAIGIGLLHLMTICNGFVVDLKLLSDLVDNSKVGVGVASTAELLIFWDHKHGLDQLLSFHRFANTCVLTFALINDIILAESAEISLI